MGKHEELQQLIEQFKRNISQYKNQKYDELNTRVDKHHAKAPDYSFRIGREQRVFFVLG